MINIIKDDFVEYMGKRNDTISSLIRCAISDLSVRHEHGAMPESSISDAISLLNQADRYTVKNEVANELYNHIRTIQKNHEYEED